MLNKYKNKFIIITFYKIIIYIIIKLSDGTNIVKLIYGFNSKDTFEEIMKMEDTRINKQVNRLNQMLKDSQKEKLEKLKLK